MSQRPISLTTRLMLSIGTVIIFVLLTFGWLVERSIKHHFVEQDVAELNAVAQALQHALLTLPPQPTLKALNTQLRQVVSTHNSVQFSITSNSEKETLSTADIDLISIARNTVPVSHITVDNVALWNAQDKSYRGAVLLSHTSNIVLSDTALPNQAAPQELKIIVAISTDFHQHFLDSFGFVLRLTTFLAGLISLIAIFIAVYQGHAPLRHMSREIQSIGSKQLSTRIDTRTVSAELAELASSFNTMLDRLENAFQRLSDFSGDIAHELRTPISNLKIQTEVALTQARTVQEYREVLYSNLEEYERMTKMLSDMLFLAQADNKLLKPELIKIALHDEISLLFEFFEALTDEHRIQLKLNTEHAYILGDRLMIRRALSNVLSNAIRYTPPNNTIKVTIHCDAKGTAVQIENPGSKIPAKHLEQIFERFYRTDPSRHRTSEGAGLGLAIAKSIMDAHHGTLSVQSSELSTLFEFYFPVIEQ